jgi:dienelactone hydrolase
MADTTLRQAILARLGSFPPRVPLDLEGEPETDQGDHTRALVTYAVEPGERVPAWLLRPKGTAPPGGRPAIGYVVLCPDLLCFEDRRPPEAVRQANPYQDGSAYERFEFTRRILAGACLQTKYLHDLACALDVLAGLPDVDSGRLGAIGNSLGGQETLWLTWYDERVRAAVSSCGFGLIRTILRDGINHNFALYIPDLLDICDLDTLVADLAPRPFMLTAGTTDRLFPLDGVQAIVERASAAYEQEEAPERFRALIFEGGHQFPDDVKAEAYAFLDRWLGPEEVSPNQ